MKIIITETINLNKRQIKLLQKIENKNEHIYFHGIYHDDLYKMDKFNLFRPGLFTRLKLTEWGEKVLKEIEKQNEFKRTWNGLLK